MRVSSLREKDKQILNLITEHYLKIGKPISSGSITQKIPFPVSPATVRNIMNKLEQHGYLFQPHTSAGRIPTDKGLRLYVNSLFEEAVVPGRKVELPENFSLDQSDFNVLLSQVSKILAEHSDNLGFVLSPRISRIDFRHIRFIKVSEFKVMIILITTSNFVINEFFQTNIYFTQLELEKASQYINQNFRGKNLSFVRDYLLQELPKFKVRYESLIDRLIAFLKSYITQEENENQIFLQGAPKLLEKHDLFDMEKLKTLFQNFEEKAKLAKLLSDFISLERVKVLIGSEANIPDISDCSLILSHYGYQSQILGSLGIIGPKRIPYKKIIPLVDSVANRLSQAISNKQ
ncbi:MAG: heat-inducible transcriptional repressor HrcA [Candidatus Aminicenantes bacterium]|nr:heat-inducible transcriptional repressor HrcA [Candidatus Aminicenantes bacterium]MDH5466286.1 heat-inducible transcriptional repressor HrcA [Candidatus Aminicenantes bacterium]MDH5705871.1 heat-inducible transcriptional repressor HrcA [Candidatus Aminicenantes bacterium]